MFKKKILALTLASLFVLGMASCDTNGGGEEATSASEHTAATSQTNQTTGEDASMIKIVDGEKTDYKIVYSATADVFAYHAAEYISDRITEATGVTPRVVKDDTPASEYEIVIGSTNRDNAIGFDAEAHDWTIYPVHIGVYGNRLFLTADENIDIYENLSFVMDKWLEGAKAGELGVNDKICKRMMRAAGSVDDNVISILCQNLCTFGDAPNRRQDRFPRAYEEFKYYDADIIGVSEAIPQWLTYLDGVLIPDGYTRLGGKNLYNGVDGDWNNIYYKTDKFDVVEWNTFWYSETPDVPGSTLPGTSDKKVATWALFEVKNTGKRFVVMNTHLQAYSGYDAIRAQQIAIFTEFLEPYMKDYPVYVLGDMNIEESFPVYNTVLETFHDSRDVAKENLSGEQDTYNAFGAREADGDYIFTGKGDNQEILWYKIIREKQFGDYTFAEDEWISDHYGVCVQTRIS